MKKSNPTRVFFKALVFSCLLLLSATGLQAQSGKNANDCSERSLTPYLYADMCVPYGTSFRNGEKKVVCDDYHLVNFSISFRVGKMKFMELAKCEEEPLRTVYDDIAGMELPEGESFFSQTATMIIIEKSNNRWTLHSFRSPSGWPYHILAEVVGTQEDMEKVKYSLESLDFGSADTDF